MQEDNKKQQEQLAAFAAELKKLQEEREKQEKDLAALDKKLSDAKSENERAKLLAEKQALEAKIAENEEAQKSSKKR